MHPATLHGVGVITKLYFVIFAVFKASMTLNLAQRSFKVIDFHTNRKRVYIFLYWSIATWTLSCTFSEIRRLKGRKSTFSQPHSATPIPAKIWGVPFGFWNRSVMLGWLGSSQSAESEKVRLISREIIFQEFQPIWPRYLNVTDRWTDGRTTCLGNTALRVGAPKIIDILLCNVYVLLFYSFFFSFIVHCGCLLCMGVCVCVCMGFCLTQIKINWVINSLWLRAVKMWKHTQTTEWYRPGNKRWLERH